MPPLTEEQCLLILNGLPHIGPVTLHRLLAALGGDPGRVLTAPREELLQVQGVAAARADRTTGSVVVSTTGAGPDVEALVASIVDEGYTVHGQPVVTA